MAVVISEFEVVPEAAQGERSSSGAGAGQGEARGGASGPTAPTPNEIRRILRRQLERIARVRAD